METLLNTHCTDAVDQNPWGRLTKPAVPGVERPETLVHTESALSRATRCQIVEILSNAPAETAAPKRSPHLHGRCTA
jgi:hypothetical protein